MSDQWIDFLGVQQLNAKKGAIISIQAKGTLGINRAAFELLGRSERVIFLYDKQRGVIGMRPAGKEEYWAYAAKQQGQQGGYLVNGQLFFQYLGYPLGEVRRFTPQREDNILVINLDSGLWKNRDLVDDGWHEFRGKRQIIDKCHPIVTIQARGNFGLNRQAYEALGQPDHVILRYHQGRNALGIQPATGGPARTYAVKKQNPSDSFIIAGRAFLQFIDYPLGEGRPYYPKVEGQLLVIELSAQ